jgi:hypothetical protein
MVYLLLDIDGVMVPAKSWERPELLSDGFMKFSDSAVSVLRSIISENVTVVLTTSHKSRYSLEKWKMFFSNRGLVVESLIKLADNNENISRKDEILKWFDENDSVNDFIIIDDDKSLNELPGYLKRNLIQTQSTVGLTFQHLSEIRDKFPVVQL